MSLYMNTDKPAMGSRIRPTTSKDNIGGGAGLDKLNKRVVKNAKFANVKSTLDTGANAGNVKVKVDRSGEMFRRVNRRQLHQLMMACESGDESIYRLQDRWDSVEDNDDAASTRSGMSSRSNSSAASYASSASVSSATGTVIATHTSSTGSAPAAASAGSCASDYFILLDVRDDESQFRAFHIEGSIHYPPSCLRRDYFPASLYRFKNAADKLIILVDSDETSRIGLECATLFLQKGFQNIFVLTGGLKHFGIKYQDRIVGEALQPPPQRRGMGSTGTGAGTGAGGVSNRSQALAGMPASSRPFTGASAASAAASARPASSASARMQQQQQQQPYQQQPSSRPTSLNFNAGAASAASAARPGATQLGGGGFGSSRPMQGEDRESPRAALGRQQQQQQQQQQAGSSSSVSSAPSHRSRLSNGSAAGAAGVSTGGHAQISSRAFR